jgi:hypothetical protein
MATASVTLSQGFPKGTKARAFVRASDTFTPSGSPAASASADDKGQIRLSGLEQGAFYYVQVEGQPGARTVQAKGPEFNDDGPLHRHGPEATARILQRDRDAQAKVRREAEKTDPLVASPAPGRTVVSNAPDKKTSSVAEPQPGPKQQEFSGPQRSDTPDGQAHPKDPKEPVPDVRQEDVAASTPQRSSTETGVATVKDLKEQVPAIRQEDISWPQRSNTETGQAEPKPKVRGAEVQKRDDSSPNRARGNTPAKAEEQTTKPAAKQTTRTGTRKRSSAKKN